MMREKLEKLLNDYKNGKISVDEFLNELKWFPFENIEFAKVDHHRMLKHNFPEVILCQWKTPKQVREIAKRILEKSKFLLATRANLEHFKEVKKIAKDAKYNELARTITVIRGDIKKDDKKGKILIITAGTADLPVAEEARVTAEILGNEVEILYDVGVAGLHRLLSNFDKLKSASVIIVVAGMEGALPSVVGGLVGVPVIAVPTSIGYGANFNGLAPLLTMLNTCAPGVVVVNIDNGFGAAFAATLMNRK
ncbi:MAG: nickel pincer cofactor biosynthesis protein LarB [Candidatus Kryptonium sp.]|nr:nickel pincer cofactor biosynthesis protein LarB [Candidatus Kryptonium sp.]MCX7762028.1 nickel pincer cofactor biosynthesis protein LarB [Candidatus Kryptonium sp.]MDW8108368.1 nickel pincer cofactor biosynthesis protein LarB [Candidatus Kryptonium sp.]